MQRKVKIFQTERRADLKSFKKIFLGVLCILCGESFCVSQAGAVEWILHGALKNETAYFVSGDKRFDKTQNRLDLKPEAVFGGGWEFRGRTLAWYDAAMDVNATNTTDLTAGIKQHYRTRIESKEAYLLYGGDDFDLRLGQQQIVWGKTDGIRMLDIINPFDLREFILDDFLDSRIGLWSARLNYYADIGGAENEFEFVLVPDARPAEFAPIGSRWGFALPPAPPGIAVISLASGQPNWALKNMEAGIAWRANVAGWDLSLNYYYGWNDRPNQFKQLVGTTMTLQLKHLRMHTVGGSFSNAFGAFVVRGEAAVNFGEGINTTSLLWSRSVVRRTTLNGAIAIDYTQSNWIIGVQLFGRHVLNEPTINPLTTPSSSFFTLRLATDYMNEKLKPEVLLLTDLDEGAILLRPKLSYEFSDQWTGWLGADIFAGSGGAFGQFAANDRIYSEIEWSF
jgi:hypothetical protein